MPDRERCEPGAFRRQEGKSDWQGYCERVRGSPSFGRAVPICPTASHLPRPVSSLTTQAPAPRQDAAPTSARGGTGARERDLRFVERVHRMRTLGLGLGFFCVGSVFRVHGESWLVWGLLVSHGFIWPHVARAIAVRSA